MTNTASIALTRTWTSVLWDLDGPITDSAPGIIESLAFTFSELGMPVPSEDVLMSYVGPPLLESFTEIAGLNNADAWNALEVYRAHYGDRVLQTAVYPGIAGLLARLHAAGIPIALATSKPESVAIRVLEHFKLSQYFTTITGSSEDETLSHKADIVRVALERLTAAGADITHAVMVGDRHYDSVGAAANGVPTIMVEWGYGSPAEAEGTIATVYSADQLDRLLLG